MRLIVSIDWFEPGNSIRVPGETTHPHLNHISSENSEMLELNRDLLPVTNSSVTGKKLEIISVRIVVVEKVRRANLNVVSFRMMFGKIIR